MTHDRDRTARINAEARATVARLRDLADPRSPLDVADHLLSLPDAGVRWRAEMEEIAVEREAAKAEIASAPRPAPPDWWDAIDERIAAALAVERRLVAVAIGEAVGKLLNEERRNTMKAARDEMRELKIEIAKHASEVAALREALAVERSKVVDIPSPLSRRVN